MRMSERSFFKKRAIVAIVLLLSFIFGFSLLSFVCRRNVQADGEGMWGGGTGWEQGDGQYCVNFGFYGYNDGDVITFHLQLNFSYFYIVSAGGISSYSVDDVNGVFTGTITYNSSSPDYTLVVGGTFDSPLSIVSTGVDGVTYSTPTTTTTAAPTSTPTPIPAATTAAPAATTAAPETTAAAPAGGGTTSGEESSAASSSETTTSETSESTDETEEEETAEESSENSVVALDNPTLIADEAARHDEPVSAESISEDNPDPTKAPAVVARTKSSGGHSAVWIVVAAVLIGGAGFRYVQLKKQEFYGSELAMEFIPGRVIGNLVDKIRPSKVSNTAPVTAVEEKPKVINGYLQTSNTRSIRPEFSNAAALAKLEQNRKPENSNTIPGLKPPVKRPASASVNHAAAAKADVAAKDVKPVTENTTAPGLKPPIKRPASASVNHAAVAAATATVSKKAEDEKKKKDPFRKNDAHENKIETPSSDNNKTVVESDTIEDKKVGSSGAFGRVIMNGEKKYPEGSANQMNNRSNGARRNSMNRSDKGYLSPTAAPTAAASAFKKSMSEKKGEAPSIATQFVPPVIKKEETRKPSPFKQIKRPTGADVDEAAEVVRKENEKAAPNIALSFIPMAAPARKEEINPFKSNKGPIKRPSSASVNRAAAEKEEPEEVEEVSSETETKKMSFTAALREHERATSFRPSGEFGGQDKIDPFKHNVDSEGNALKSDSPQD